MFKINITQSKTFGSNEQDELDIEEQEYQIEQDELDIEEQEYQIEQDELDIEEQEYL